MGLIAKAEILRGSVFFDTEKNSLYGELERKFAELRDAIGIERAGFLYPDEKKTFALHFAFGLDITTLHRMVIPFNTIKNVLPQNNWICIEGANLEALRVYFSSHEFASLKRLYLYPIKIQNISLYIIFFDSLLNVAGKNFQPEKAATLIKNFLPSLKKAFSVIKITKLIYPFQKGQRLIKERIDAAIMAENTANLFTLNTSAVFPNIIRLHGDISKLRLYYALINRLMVLVGTSNLFLFESDLQMQIVIFSVSPIDAELYITQLRQSVQEIFGLSVAEKLLIASKGNSKDSEEVLKFLHLKG
ncbi:hypothetical protein DWQ65_12800 [Treponema phagedenis]|uniref:Uncharacterized protein n=1 Tax=Treponema phagedenis TaxID=162 RepID=A0A0B7GUN6_TREPH|nr:hypothetical protein [Treponema phagedenis]NVP23334.1 hypothetical protein [Treponema phagedenis]QEJ98441.1 hypothetical protein FUT82_10835 [Treponema phagedenis]QEK01402.1 hypothetical protein FUT84_09740 [Treponema phagedenis]QEK03949.1 hypothetical protein FUT83_09145 [Treponema phagedenis]QEK06421.1 hypothetical protein FUT80_06670 [Treponema phagedenis]